jgi:large subunit ribosomal protein L13
LQNSLEKYVKTTIVNDKDIKRTWKLVDAENQTLGRLASRVAVILTGKDKPGFSPHQDWGDYVIIVNAGKVRVTGRKAEVKTYFRHSGYPGGTTFTKYKDLMQEKPTEAVRHAVKGMIKHKRPLGRRIFKKLFVYAGAEHPHASQKPEAIKL